MFERTRRSIIIDGSPETCMSVITDYQRYPEWVEDVKSVEILSHDDDGRAGLVRYRAAAMGRSASATLQYFYGSNPLRVSWHLIEGEPVRRYDGRYLLEPHDSSQGSPRTKVTYELEVEIAVPLPAFVRRRSEVRVVRAALQDLRRQIEMSSTR